MKPFYCDNFSGHYPVGTGAIIVAEDQDAAIAMLEKELAGRGLKQKIEAAQVIEITLDKSEVTILADGNY